MTNGNEDKAKALLDAWKAGDTDARDKLFELAYGELRQISAALLRAERNISLSTGDLVNEAAIRMMRLDRIDWSDKAHFMALSARAMRRVLVDHARKKHSDKRKHEKVTLVTRVGGGAERMDLDDLDKALIRLSNIDPKRAEIVELRYFGGLTLEEVAEVTGSSDSTVKRSWRVARAWLAEAMQNASDDRNAVA
ncbi:MAG: ECF-type sigma factor [Pseudomonadota bacterium]